MTSQTTDRQTHETGSDCLSPLLQLAWSVANAAYHVPAGEQYRATSRALHREAMHEHILELFARSDEQNAYLDAVPHLRMES